MRRLTPGESHLAFDLIGQPGAPMRADHSAFSFKGRKITAQRRQRGAHGFGNRSDGRGTVGIKKLPDGVETIGLHRVSLSGVASDFADL